MSRRLARAGVVVAGGAALGLWLVDREHPSLWTDEALTVRFSETSAATTSDFHPPLPYVLYWLWRMVTPDEVAWLRLLPAVLTLAAVSCWLAFWQARRRNGELSGAAVAVAVALTVASPHLLLYGRMVRYFAPASLLVGATVALWWKALDGKPRTWAVIGAALTGAALGATSYVVAASLAVALTAFALLRRRSRFGRHLLISGAASALAAAVVVASSLASSPPADTAGVQRLAVAALLPLWSATVGETVNILDLVIVVPAAAAWAVIGVTLMPRLRRSPDVVVLSALLVAAGLAGTTVGSAVVGLEHTAVQAPKLLAPFAPALYLLAGVSVARLVAARRRLLASAAIVGIAVAWVPGIINLHGGTDFLYTSYALPWNDVVDMVAVRVDEDSDRQRSVAVVTVDPALSFLLADRRPRADVLELDPAGTRVVTAGAERPDDYDVVIVVDRDRVNVELDAAIDGVREALRSNGYRETETVAFGDVDPSLRRLQERLADRELSDALVTVIVFERS